MSEPAFFGFTPMEGVGAEVDLASGHPAEYLRAQDRAERADREEQKRHERAQRVWRILHDLEGQGGEVVYRLLDLAVARVQELRQSDFQLRRLLDIFEQVIGNEIPQGERFARVMVLDLCAQHLRVTLPRTGTEDAHG